MGVRPPLVNRRTGNRGAVRDATPETAAVASAWTTAVGLAVPRAHHGATADRLAVPRAHCRPDGRSPGRAGAPFSTRRLAALGPILDATADRRAMPRAHLDATAVRLALPRAHLDDHALRRALTNRQRPTRIATRRCCDRGASHQPPGSLASGGSTRRCKSRRSSATGPLSTPPRAGALERHRSRL
jgi:hypothetical protein